MEVKNILFETEIKLLQELRLIHAIAETGHKINVKPSEKFKLEPLEKKFNFSVGTGSEDDFPIANLVKIDHKTPKVSIGNITRTLIFPHSIVTYCKSLWKGERTYRFVFTGWMSYKRKKELEHWISEKWGIKQSIHSHKEYLPKIKNHFRLLLGLPEIEISYNRELRIIPSGKGRKFPDKAWDEEYYRTLANSKFVLCPSGNSVWTYRFFEAILCGAIPVVEETCEAYIGFTYFSFNDPIEEMNWDQKIVDENFKLCLERITVAPEISKRELEKILT
ncbi:Exostosin family protein [Salinimicrobium sediminis]|uniref:Exostosin family protein n=1 Tax=Salinimicrobium sediminis TaxID=1343891 RepID=A0A285WZV7_9FLAO|nr:exostosin family protein [Salinimicrobium sediminis]SOC78588.1 Exostosin family protein [Salinimicrobium sediminis]